MGLINADLINKDNFTFANTKYYGINFEKAQSNYLEFIYTHCCMGETLAVLMAYNVKNKNIRSCFYTVLENVII